MSDLTDDDLNLERRKQRALNRLGSNPRCAICGENDWRCLERHHIAGRASDQMTGVLCRNCHRKQSDPSNNEKAPADPSVMERIAQFLIGLADLLTEMAKKLKEYGCLLIDGAKVCPSPWGCAG
jgi:hypothetical protein